MRTRLIRSTSAVLARTYAYRRTIRAASAVIAALGCALVGVGMVGLTAGRDIAQFWIEQPGDELRVPATGANWVQADGADPGDPATLRAGDTGGGAVTYIRFEVPDTGRVPERARVQLTGAGSPLPSLVELVTVPDTTWQPEGLSWESAPLLGWPVRSAWPEPDDRLVTFDVTGLVTAPGVYAFAVTVPSDLGHVAFAGPGTGDDQPVLRLTWADPTPSPDIPSPSPDIPSPSPDIPSPSPSPLPYGPPPGEAPGCVLAELLVPTCGVLWGTAPGGHTGSSRTAALASFEEATGRRQDIYHAYHRADSLFPTAEEVTIAAEGRLLFLNWKPLNWSWAQIAAGHPAVDSYLDRLAEHINSTYPEPFFFTVHHEPENDVRTRAGSGWEATDYAAMYRYVVQRLRAAGVDNLVTVMNYMAYVPWNAKSWFPDLYPGDDVVDWIAWNAYAYSDPGYGHGDFAEMVNRRSADHPDWPGFYSWATEQFPDKPFMLGEWGVWYSDGNPGHMAEFYDSAGRQTPLLPRIKAMVYFDTPGDQRDRDSRPTATEAGLAAYQRLGAQPFFQVQLPPAYAYGP